MATRSAAEVGVDALRFTCSLALLDDVQDRLADLLGPEERLRRGFYHYTHGQKYGCGALLLWDGDETNRKHAAVCVELKGKSIGQIGQLATWELWAWAAKLGAKCTRLDVRADLLGRPGLIDACIAACERGELKGLRRFDPRKPRASSGELLGHSCDMGRRGRNGCGRYTRVYDKGLETGEKPAGEWERWEVEFSQLAADLVAQDWYERGHDQLVQSEGDAGMMVQQQLTWLAQRAFGACDFRTSDRLDRSERAGWWSKFLDGLQVIPTIARRQASTLEGFRQHVRRTLAPTLSAMAAVTKQSLGQVLELLIGDPVDLRRVSAMRPSVVEFAASRGSLEAIDFHVRRTGAGGVDRWRSWLDGFLASNVPPSLFQVEPVPLPSPRHRNSPCD